MENLNYLTAGLPTRPGYASVITKRLNDKGLRPVKGDNYTTSIVYNVVYGRSVDDNVKVELIRYRAECAGKGAQVNSHLNAALAALAA